MDHIESEACFHCMSLISRKIIVAAYRTLRRLHQFQELQSSHRQQYQTMMLVFITRKTKLWAYDPACEQAQTQRTKYPQIAEEDFQVRAEGSRAGWQQLVHRKVMKATCRLSPLPDDCERPNVS